MIEYNNANTKLSDLQLNKLKSPVQNQTEMTLRMNIKMFNGINLTHELLLTTREKTKPRKTFRNNMSTAIKLSKTKISDIIKSGGFLGSLLSKIAYPLMKVAVQLGKNILAPSEITAAF